MPLNSFLLAGLLASLMPPVWAVTAPDTAPRPLTSAGTTDRRAPTPLQIFIARVWAESPAVQGAQAAVEAARARRDGAGRPLYNPALEMDAERTDVNTTSIGLRQTIDWDDKRQVRQRIARDSLSAVETELVVIRRQVAVEVLSNLSRYQTAREQRQLAVQRAKLMKDFAATAKRHQQAGDVSRLDLALARVAYIEARMQQGAADAVLISAEAALLGVTGLARIRWPALPRALPRLSANIDIEDLVVRLPGLVFQQHQVAGAKARIDLARRMRRPDPSVGIRGGREDNDTLLGLSLEIPLFVRNSFRAEVRAAAQEASQAEQMFMEKRRRARARMEGAMAGYRAAAAAWRAWRDTGQSSLNEQISLLEQLWEVGELSATEYLIQASQNVQTQSTAAALAGRLWMTAIEWLDASGKIEQWLIKDK